MKARVTLVETLSSDPYYMVEYYVDKPVDHWALAKCFVFRHGEKEESLWSQEKNLTQAMELAKRLESQPNKTEIVVYQTNENGRDEIVVYQTNEDGRD